ncbi:MAG TPA: hypothetical protein VFX67_03430, partial [Burkholderiales bacterium]|nr:hypothetical protein [Burkholderiales bacterium]
PFLSVFAGIFLLHLRGILERSRRFMVGLIVASFGWNLTTYAKAYEPVVPQEKLAAFGWIREHTEPDAIVFDATFAASYLSRRASSHMPYPASESVRTVTVRPLVAEMMKSGKPPAAAGQRRLIHLYAGDASKISASQLLWVHPSGTLAAVELNPLRRPATLGRQP